MSSMFKKMFTKCVSPNGEKKADEVPAAEAPVASDAAAAAAAEVAEAQVRSEPGVETADAATAIAAGAVGTLVSTKGVAASSEWLTSLLEKLWPYVGKAVEKQVKEMVPGILEANLPKWMEGISLDKFELGSTPPKITFINVDQDNDDEVDDVRLEIGLDWVSKADIELTVKPLKVAASGFLKSIVAGLTNIHAGVEELSIKATAVITMVPMIPMIPVLRSVQVCLREQPKLDFDITFGAVEFEFLNLLKPWILQTLKGAVFANMVYPEHITVKLDPTVPDYFKPEGLLLVTVVGAKGLPKSDWFSGGDPFVKLSVRDKWRKRTATKAGEDPEFGESFEFMVHSRRFQRLSLEVLDEDTECSADTVGFASCSLSDVEPGKEETLWLDLYKQEADKAPIKGAKVQVTIKYLTSALPEIVALATQPTDPLPVGGDTMLHGGIMKVSFRTLTIPSKEAGPIMAEVKACGEARWSGSIAAPALTPDLLTIPTIQVFDFDILAKDVETPIEISLFKKKGAPALASFVIYLNDVKAKDPQVGITGGLFEFSAGGYALATDVYYHDI